MYRIPRMLRVVEPMVAKTTASDNLKPNQPNPCSNSRIEITPIPNTRDDEETVRVFFALIGILFKASNFCFKARVRQPLSFECGIRVWLRADPCQGSDL